MPRPLTPEQILKEHMQQLGDKLDGEKGLVKQVAKLADLVGDPASGLTSTASQLQKDAKQLDSLLNTGADSLGEQKVLLDGMQQILKDQYVQLSALGHLPGIRTSLGEYATLLDAVRVSNDSIAGKVRSLLEYATAQQKGLNSVERALGSIAPLKKDDAEPRVTHLRTQLALLGHMVEGDGVDDFGDHHAKFGLVTEKTLKAIQSQNDLAVTGQLDDPTSTLLDKLLLSRQVTISGQVLHAQGVPLVGKTVEAAWLRPGNDEPAIGKATTDQRGRYELRLHLPAGKGESKPGKAMAVISVHDGAAVIAESAAIDLHPGSRSLDFVITAETTSLYQAALAAAKPHTGGALGNVFNKGTFAHERIEILSRDSGLPVHTADWLVRAHELEATAAKAGSTIQAEVFFALLKAGLPADPLALTQLPRARLLDAIAQAARRGVIASPLAAPAAMQSIETALDSWHARLLTQTPTNDPRKASVFQSEKLGTHKEALAQRYANHRGTLEEFWKLESTLPDEQQPAFRVLRDMATVAPFTNHHLTLTEALVTSQITSVPQLVGLTPQGWLDHVKKLETQFLPTDISGSTPKLRQINYARQLAAHVEDACPADVFIAHLDTEPYWGVRDVLKSAQDLGRDVLGTQSLYTWQAELVRQFGDDKFDSAVKFQSLARLIPAHAATGIRPALKDSEDVAAGLVSRFAAVKQLLVDGFTSPTAIARCARNAFLNRMGATLGGRARAELIHRAAVERNAQAVALWARYHPALNRTEFRAIGGERKRLSQSTVRNGTTEDWRAIFGEVDRCACPEGKSVLSPAAYLVDLLAFLKDRGETTVYTPFATRRPDIAALELSNANAQTALPYVDLVIERLEGAIAGVGDYSMYQTTRTADELLTEPEHTNTDAYTTLRENCYPWCLPFNKDWLQQRTFLEPLKLSAHELREVFAEQDRPDCYAQPDIAREYLGMNPEEWCLLTPLFIGNRPGQPGLPMRVAWELWGLEQDRNNLMIDGVEDLLADWVGLLQVGLVVANRAGISLRDVLALGNCQYIGIKVASQCGTPPTVTLTDVNVITAARMHNFLRLWRHLGWSMRELDMALQKLHPVEAGADPEAIVPEPVLVKLSLLKRLQERTGLPVDELLAWWYDIDTCATYQDYSGECPVALRSVSERVFGKGFQGNDDDPIRADLATISAGVRLGASDILDLCSPKPPEWDCAKDADGNETKEASASIRNLTRLFRFASLTRVLGLPYRDVKKLCELIGINPFASPIESLRFLHRSMELSASRLNVWEWSYLIRGEAQPGAGIGLEKDQLDSLWKDLDKESASVSTFKQGDDPSTRLVEPLKSEADFDAQIKTIIAGLGVTGAKIDALYGLIKGAMPDSDSDSQESGWRQLIGELPDIFPQVKAAEDRLIPFEQCNNTDEARLEKWRSRWSFVREFIEDGHQRRRYSERQRWLHTALAGRFEVSKDVMERLLLDVLKPTKADCETVTDELLSWIGAETLGTKEERNKGLRRVERACKVVCHFKLNELELNLTGTDAPLEFLAAPGSIANVWKLLAYVRVRESLLPDAKLLVGDPMHWPAFDAIGDALNWPTDDIAKLRTEKDGWIGNKLTDKQAVALERMAECFRVLRQLGASVNTVQGWLASDDSAMGAFAKDVVGLARGRFPPRQWRELARPLRDKLREKQREALSGYLLANPPETSPPDTIPPIRNLSDLSAHYLMDVEMSPCQLTTRIKMATGAVQIFVQRCLMGQEAGIDASPANDSGWLQWEWQKNYRVWEANRKVFLYPENWIEPELRDDKSPFFKELEDELMQGDLTPELAEAAFLHYLEKLAEVARLEICAFLREKESTLDGNPADEVLHVVARTYGLPQRYFYRQRVKRGSSERWRAWEPLDIDVQGNHHLFCVWNRQLHLFWPILTKEEIPNSNPAKWQWKIDLAWTIRGHTGQWQARRISADSLPDPTARPESTLRLECQMTDSELRIPVEGIGSFVMDDASGTVRALIANGASRFPQQTLPKTRRVYSRLEEYGYWTNAAWSAELIQLIQERVKSLVDLLCQIYPSSQQWMTDWYEGWSKLASSKEITSDWLWQWASLLAIVGFSEALSSAQQNALATAIQNVRQVIPVDPLVLGTARSDTGPIHPIGVLGATPSQFSLWQERLLHFGDNSAPIFYADGTSTFLVEPTDVHFRPDRVLQHAIDSAPSPAIEANAGWPRLAKLMPGQQYGTLETPEKPGDRPPPTAKQDDGTVSTPTQPDKSLFHPFAGELVLAGHYDAKYAFRRFYHPFVATMQRTLRRHGVAGLLQRDLQGNPALFSQPGDVGRLDFALTYQPDTSVCIPPADAGVMDFSGAGAYAQYNWEIFFHIPYLIADRLSKNQRFEAARRWWHYIFDPTGAGTDATTSVKQLWRFWEFHRLTGETPPASINDILVAMAQGGKEFVAQVQQSMENPFNPHAIARLRVSAYQRSVVMRYLDNLIAWGDLLFTGARDFEHVQEATQIYSLAQGILGRTPEDLPYTGEVAGPNVGTVVSGDSVCMDALAMGGSTGMSAACDPFVVPPSLLSTAFCVPENKKVISYWARVADRLFKIRHCQDIEGRQRQLPLYEPAIDPGLLVRARAAGVDIGAALAEAAAPLPAYRFSFMLQKALDLCNEVRSLGGAMLAAIEKKDGEALSLLRSSHELQMNEAMKAVKTKQLDEAKSSLEGTKLSRKIAEVRRDFYAKLPFMNAGEKLQQDLQGTAQVMSAIKAYADYLANILFLVPETSAGAPCSSVTTGGQHLGGALRAYSGYFGEMIGQVSQQASMAGVQGGYQHRFDEWKLQEKLATQEIEQIDKQIIAAEIRVAIAEHEVAIHDEQIAHTKEVDDFLRSKFSNRDLYQWMLTQLSGLYFRAYQLAIGVARRTERCFQFEKGVDSSNYIQFGNWDSLRKGLLAGERLFLDLKRLELAYMEESPTEFELIKHVSLRSLTSFTQDDWDAATKGTTNLNGSVGNPPTKKFTISLNRQLFVDDFPGHCFRRIRSVSITIPCVVGPFTTVSGTLRLLSSKLHRTTLETDQGETQYVHTAAIATSSGQNDSGRFELNFRDERYLPFEGAGIESEWEFELSGKGIKLETITDVILHIRYTAREATQ